MLGLVFKVFKIDLHTVTNKVPERLIFVPKGLELEIYALPSSAQSFINGH